MQLEAVRRFWGERDRWEKLALGVWVTIVLAIALRVWLDKEPSHQNVYPVFQEAAERWRAGEGLYVGDGSANHKHLYRYSPLIAALFVPPSFLPQNIGAALWRLVNAAAFLGAFIWFAKTVLPGSPNRAQRGAMLLLLLPLALGSINVGQCNGLLIGLLLATVAAAKSERWAAAGACVALATLFKVYPIALGMLLVVVCGQRFLKWFVLFLVVGFALPFILQSPANAAGQYLDWFRYLQIDDRTAMSAEDGNRDLLLLVRVWHLSVSPAVYAGIQLTAAAACAALCWFVNRRGWPERRVLTLTLTLACLWMTLLGPATESSTYILLAPAGVWALQSAVDPRSSWLVRCLAYSSYGFLMLTMVAVWFPNGHQRIHGGGAHPFAGLLLLTAVLLQEYRWSRQSTNKLNFAPESLRARAA